MYAIRFSYEMHYFNFPTSIIIGISASVNNDFKKK